MRTMIVVEDKCIKVRGKDANGIVMCLYVCIMCVGIFSWLLLLTSVVEKMLATDQISTHDLRF